jgi:hypothetical protein
VARDATYVAVGACVPAVLTVSFVVTRHDAVTSMTLGLLAGVFLGSPALLGVATTLHALGQTSGTRPCGCPPWAG